MDACRFRPKPGSQVSGTTGRTAPDFRHSLANFFGRRQWRLGQAYGASVSRAGALRETRPCGSSQHLDILGECLRPLLHLPDFRFDRLDVFGDDRFEILRPFAD